MSGIKCKKWNRVRKFEGLPKREDVNLVEEELPDVQDGGKQ